MRLSRIEAVRFGRLDDVSLGPLGSGLNVVLGPNGAGKTSLTALARYVLYGFPTKRDAEADYESDAGKRLGRLAFVDGDSEWIIERTEGVRGGSLGIHALTGPECPELVEHVTRGVSRNAFRVVFGFGLQDMQDIESGPGGDGVLSRLYAARVGLAVSPQDVRDGLDVDVAALFKPRGSTPSINTALREIKELKKQIRELEDAANRYAAQREQLVALRTELAARRQRRDETAERRSELERYAQRLEMLEERIGQSSADLRQQQAERERVQAQLESVDVDDELLDVAPQLLVLLDDVSGYRERLSALEKLELREAETRRAAVRALEAAAIDEGLAAGVVLGPESKSGIERYRDALSRADVRAQSAERAVEDARARASVPVPGATEVSSRGTMIPGIATSILGFIALAVGALFSQWVSVVVGAGLVVAGGVLAFVSRSRGARDARIPQREEHGVELAQAESLAAQRARDAAFSEWKQWAAPRGVLAAGDDPEAAALLLGAVEEWRRAVNDLESACTEIAALCDACEVFRDSLASLAGDRLPALPSAARADIPALAARVREMLADAIQARERRQGLADALEKAVESISALEADVVSAMAAQEEVRDRLALPGADSCRVRALCETAATDAHEADESYLALAGEVGRLEGELDTEGREAQMAQARLALEGHKERLDVASERYIVLATASRLIAQTQAYHERARQPEVVRRAGEVFSQITQGRYERISIPAGGGEIVAYGGTQTTPSSRLSRGSQEQLYLALRIALVEQLDEVGDGLPVLMDDVFANFDPERHAGAIQAVTELARHRQVVFFTCHPEVADLFATVEPGLTRLSLERC